MKTIKIDDVKLSSAARNLFDSYNKETEDFTDDEKSIVLIMFMEWFFNGV